MWPFLFGLQHSLRSLLTRTGQWGRSWSESQHRCPQLTLLREYDSPLCECCGGRMPVSLRQGSLDRPRSRACPWGLCPDKACWAETCPGTKQKLCCHVKPCHRGSEWCVQELPRRDWQSSPVKHFLPSPEGLGR